MITYAKEKARHVFKMSADDLQVFGEIVWLLRHTPPPVGYQRKPFTHRQERIIEEIYDAFNFAPDYREQLLNHNEQ